jgi:ribulose-phosphate 3-epimerase
MRSRSKTEVGRRRLPKAGIIQVVPSILSADFATLADEIAQVEAADLSMVHLDIMDGHFVPNLTIGPPVVTMLRGHTKLLFDTHLMISDPGKYIDAFADAGSDHLTFHIESTDRPLEILNRIRDAGLSVGVSLNPETPVSSIENVAPYCDMVLVMTVHPGFGGQPFIPEAAEKVKEVRRLVGPDVRVEVDGGIDPVTAPIAVSYGADTLVAGRAIFGSEDRVAAVEAIRAAVRQG